MANIKRKAWEVVMYNGNVSSNDGNGIALLLAAAAAGAFAFPYVVAYNEMKQRNI